MGKNLHNMRAEVILTRLGKYRTLVWIEGNLTHLVIPKNTYKKLSQRLCKEVYDTSGRPKHKVHDSNCYIKVIKTLCGQQVSYWKM